MKSRRRRKKKKKERKEKVGENHYQLRFRPPDFLPEIKIPVGVWPFQEIDPKCYYIFGKLIGPGVFACATRGGIQGTLR